jgi:hypothetical protein
MHKTKLTISMQLRFYAIDSSKPFIDASGASVAETVKELSSATALVAGRGALTHSAAAADTGVAAMFSRSQPLMTTFVYLHGLL